MEKTKHQFRLKTLLAFAAGVCVLSAMARWEIDARRDFAATKAIVGEVLNESRGHIEGLLHTASLDRLRDLARAQNLSLSDEEMSGSLRASMGDVAYSMYSHTITQTDTAEIYWVVSCDVEQVELKVISSDIDIDCHRPCSLFSTKATVSIVDRGGYDIDRSEIEEYKKTKVNKPVAHRDMREDESVIELLRRKFAERGIEATVIKAPE